MSPTFKIAEIELLEHPVVLRLPFRFGVVTLRRCHQATVRVRIETPEGRSSWGASAEMIVPKWFDKNPALSDEDNFNQERDVLHLARHAYLSDSHPATAFGHFARHHHAHLKVCATRGHNPLLANYGPALVDRAVIDALCRSLETGFYRAVQTNLLGLDASMAEFDGMDWNHFLSDLHPASQLHARHTVGMLDAIRTDELTEPVGDGLPESLEQVVRQYGHRYFKLKVGGQLQADVERLTRIAEVLDTLPHDYHVSLDGNEQYPNAPALLELLQAMRASPALRRLNASILFIEQPVTRQHALDTDLRNADLGWPVIIDESDGELDAFVRARACGYSGISSKTCKGVYRSLLNAGRCAAWSQQGPTRYFMSGEDLTVQAGLALQQDLVLVNILGITHVERNGHHYVNGMASRPEHEQRAFLQAHSDVYEHSHGATRLRIREGQLQVGSLDQIGFASGAMPDFSAMTPLIQPARAQ